MFSRSILSKDAGAVGLWVGGVVIALGGWAAVAFDLWYVVLLPGVLLAGLFGLIHTRHLYLLLGASIPLSIEVELPGRLGTDFPSEQLMWVLTGISMLWLARYWRHIPAFYLRHPITLLLLAHLGWLSLCALTSQAFVVSFKHLLAKSWYVITFYFLVFGILRTERDFRRFFVWMAIPLTLTILYVLVRHAAIGFSFDLVNSVVGPFYRNHVMYACLPTVSLPFFWYRIMGAKRWSVAWLLLLLGILILLAGINFAYTRAAYVTLAAAAGLYWIVRWRMLRAALLATAFAAVLFIGFVARGDNWLRFAPDYERTITHTRFENLLDATTRLEDISVMERVYRWVAGVYMIQERPLMGFGPGTFYFFYKKYTVSSFKTYVSNNPEGSGMHNYYLMTAVEQGLPGLFFFLALSIGVLLYGEKVYHQTRAPESRRLVAAAILCHASILLLMLMNDFIETDKIGSFFFISAALIVRTDRNNRKERAQALLQR